MFKKLNNLDFIFSYFFSNFQSMFLHLACTLIHLIGNPHGSLVVFVSIH